MSVYEFLDLATDYDAEVTIYNLTTDEAETLTIYDATIKYGGCEIMSFDSYIYKNTLCLNIEK